MSETLREQQSRFVVMVGELISRATDLGYELTFGDAYRDPRVPYGHPDSLHKQRLAIDLNLFRNGKYLQLTADHQTLGEWWESVGGTWGGRFGDGNHYSLERDGMK
jgi:hypothetical protein